MAKRAIIFLNFDQKLCSGSHSACRAAHFPVVKENYGAGLALRLAVLEVSRFLWHCSEWTRHSVLEILQYKSGLEVLPFSMDTDLNYSPVYSSNIFEPVVMFRSSFCSFEKNEK